MDVYVPPKLPKSDIRVSLRPAWDETADTSLPHCGGCRFYQWGSCSLVEGSIAATEVCDLFHEPVKTYVPDSSYGYAELASVAASTGNTKLFVATTAFAETVDGAIVPPEWMPLLPVPGTYRHAAYGDIEISRERNAGFVDNFVNRVYGQDIPVDAEHELKLSGAIGHIKDIRQNSDGSVDGRVDWTERGEKLVKGGGYRYVSPEWFLSWDQPETGTTFHDVLIGAAICTRPFFKENALRGLLTALVASESGIRHDIVTEQDSAGNPTTITETDLAVVPTVVHVDATGGPISPPIASTALTPADTPAGTTSTDAAASGATGMTDTTKTPPVETVKDQPTVAQFSELQGRIQAAETRATTAETESTQLKERLASIEKADRTRRFGEVAKVWQGDADKHVGRLVQFAETFGEDSDLFKDYVADQTAQATRFSEMLKERGAPLGSTQTSDTGIAGTKLSAERERIKASEPTLTDVALDVKSMEALAIADPQAYAELTR